MKKILIYDAYALNKSEIIGGSSRSLLNFLSKNNGENDIYFLTNKSNRDYFKHNIEKYKIKEVYFDFPNELMKYGKNNREKYEKSLINKINIILFKIIPFNLKLRRYLKKNKFDKIICNELRATATIGLSSIFSKIRLISFLRGDYKFNSMKSKILRYISDELICISDGIYNLLSEVEKKKAKKINECIKIYKDIEYKKISFKEEIIITTIGNVVYYKGHHILVEALGKSGYKNFKLNIIGTIVDKEHYSYILDLIEKYNLNNKVNFLGKQENVHKFLEKTSIFVLPSINEGFGIVNLEAALHKLPIIASDLPGIKSFIKENFTGLLFKCGDSNDLSKKIKYIINNESKANELGENAYKELLENYNLEKNSDKFYEFIVKGE